MLKKTSSINLSKAGPFHPVIDDATAGLVDPNDKLINFLSAHLETKALKKPSTFSFTPIDNTLYRVESD